jgi:hypothetical protein
MLSSCQKTGDSTRLTHPVPPAATSPLRGTQPHLAIQHCFAQGIFVFQNPWDSKTSKTFLQHWVIALLLSGSEANEENAKKWIIFLAICAVGYFFIAFVANNQELLNP